MKIDEKLVVQGFIDNTIQFEPHERVPFFLVDSNSLLEDNVVVDTYYTEVLQGQIYAKMDSTSRKNPDASFDGAEPTAKNYMALERQKIWAENFPMILADNIRELRVIENMELETYKEYIQQKLKDEKNDVTFTASVTSDCMGEDKQYTINLKVANELLAQINDARLSGSDVVAFHDDSRTLHEAYTLEQATELYKDIKMGIAQRDAYYDIFITRASQMTTKLPLEVITDVQLTETELSYVQSIVYEIG